MKKTKTTNEPATNQVTQGFKQHYAGTKIGERGIQGNEAVKKNDDSENSEREPTPPEAMLAAWEFTRDPHNSTAITAIFTVVIAATGFAYTVFAGLQWTTMQQTLTLERPWIGPTERTLRLLVPANGGNSTETDFRGVSWGFKNSGRSTATRVRAHLELHVGPLSTSSPKEEEYPVSEICKESLPNQGTIAIPGVGMVVDIWAPPNVINSLPKIHQSLDVYLVGCVDYSDSSASHNYRTNVREVFDSARTGFTLLNSGNDAY